jgi:lipopolysaccharide biosynthesis glycosyltransferase
MNIMLAGNDKVYYGIELVIYSTMAHNKNVHWYIVTMDYEQQHESQNAVHVYKGFQEW